MKIKWALNELRRQDNEPIRLDGQVNLEDSLIDRKPSIMAAGPVTVDGWIIVEGEDTFIVDAKLKVQLTLPSTRSLEAVDITIKAKLQETYLAPGYEVSSEEQSQEELIIELDDQILDLQKPIEDAILLAIPSKVLTEEEASEDIFPKGNDWEVKSEDDHNSNKEIQAEEDSPFAALKDLFPEE